MLASLQKKVSAMFSHRVTLALSFIILLPPWLVEQVKTGIDPSWKIALSYANLNGLLFGRDIVFTYGPLHFFITKAGTLYAWKWAMALFDFTAISALLLIFSRVYHRETHPLKGLLLVLLSFLLSNISCDYYLMLIFLYAAFCVLAENKTIYLWVMLLIAVLTFYIKINFGFINFFVLALVAALHAWKERRKIPVALVVSALFPACIFLLSPLLHVENKGYVLNGLKIIDDYNDAMNLPFSAADPVDWIGVTIACIFIFFLFANIRFFLRAHNIFLALIFLLYFFLLFKMGFVRIDAHLFIFIFNALLFYLLFFIWNSALRFIRQAFLLTMLLGFLSIPIGVLNYVVFKQDSWMNPLEKLNVWEYPRDVVANIAYKGKIRNDNVEAFAVSETQLQLIGEKTVDVLPEDISVSYRHGLKYNPRPVVQSYSAYGLYLDSLNYKKYCSANAPDFLLFVNRSIDHRVPFWDESVTKRAIATRYELLDTELGYDDTFLLFAKRVQPLRDSVVAISSFSFSMNSPVEVPQTAENLYLYADVQYALWGKLLRLFFHAPLLQVEFTYADGSAEIYRCLPKILQTGVLINKRVRSNRDAYHFFKGDHEKLRRVVSFRLLPQPGFHSEVQGTFVQLEKAAN